ncbi:MAG: DegV family protein [Candidatus Heimdallarchaeota archaeon]|nr:DegV family protein [Candidatus Heimdallarchaeota archaeon]
MSIAIISDDTCDLPIEYIKKYDITIIPTKVIFSDKVFCSCGVDGELTLDEYYSRADNELPTTSTPSLGIIYKCFECALQKADSVIGIFLSDYLSPIASNAIVVVNQHFPDKNISIHNSNVTGVGLASVVLETAIMVQNGYSFEEINAKIVEWLSQVNYAGIMFTLENLVRTGRVPKTKKFLADFFKVKPIVEFVNGQITVQGKIRADDDLIIKQMKKFGALALQNLNGESNHLFIGHARWPEAAGQIASYLQDNNPKEKKIIIQETGSIVANYVGKKTLTIGYIGAFEKEWLLDIKK